MMRISFLTVCFLCLGSVVCGQSPAVPTNGPDLTIVKHSWTKERTNWEKDPFGGPVESFEDLRRRRVDERRIERARGTNPLEAAKVEREMRAEQVINARPSAPPRYAFRYRVSVSNTSAKTIKAIDWDYIFLSSNTQDETAHLEFTSEEKIAPGKTKELEVMAHKPPAKTVSVYALDKSERQGLDGEVVVVRIEYTDGTVWQRP